MPHGLARSDIARVHDIIAPYIIRAYGADVVITGDRYADALDTSERYVAESRAMPIHAFDQTETLLGQGTLARELAHQVPNAASVLGAVGGGGLIDEHVVVVLCGGNAQR
jgi:threonine dehydratase